jgi:hypothetical protein
VLDSVVPPTWTALVSENPEPVMVSDSALDPAVTLAGLIEDTAGAGVVVLPPPAELEPPPPHPLIAAVIPSPKAEKQKESEHTLPNAAIFTGQNLFPSKPGVNEL